MTIDLFTSHSIILHSHYLANAELVLAIAKLTHSSAKARHICDYENMASVTEDISQISMV